MSTLRTYFDEATISALKVAIDTSCRVLEPTLSRSCSFKMNGKREVQATERRERRIDEALKETFPASDPPAFVGGGAQQPTDDKASNKASTGKRRTKAAEMASDAIDRQADQSATEEERESRKRRLLKGPAEFRELRRDHPAQKLK